MGASVRFWEPIGSDVPVLRTWTTPQPAATATAGDGLAVASAARRHTHHALARLGGAGRFGGLDPPVR
jgi:hypothetical protein